MSVYFIHIGDVKDSELLAEYTDGARPVLRDHPHELVVVDTEAQTLEGEPPGSRVVILKFESEQACRDFYDSPGYQAVIGKRLEAVEGFDVLAKGYEPPT